MKAPQGAGSCLSIHKQKFGCSHGSFVESPGPAVVQCPGPIASQSLSGWEKRRFTCFCFLHFGGVIGHRTRFAPFCDGNRAGLVPVIWVVHLRPRPSCFLPVPPVL